MSAPPRLLIASQPLEAGVPRHVLDLLSGIPAGRFRVDVACPRDSMLWEALEGRSDMRLHPIGAQRQPGPADAVSWARLLRLVGAADVVHAHSSKAGFLARAAAAARGRGGRCVFTPHGWSFWSADGARRRLYLGLERRAARWCRTIVAVSRQERDAGLAARVGREAQYRIIPNGIDTARFGADPGPVEGRLVSLGRLAPPKRPDLIVRALADLADRFPAAELHLVGEGPLAAETERLAAALGVRDRIRLLGPRDDIAEILTSAHALVLASDYEGAPLTILEAMAAGVPVVATRVGGVPEVVEDGTTGILVAPDDAAALASALGRVLADPPWARAMGNAGRAAARARFGISAMVERTLQVYDAVLAASGAHPSR